MEHVFLGLEKVEGSRAVMSLTTVESSIIQINWETNPFSTSGFGPEESNLRLRRKSRELKIKYGYVLCKRTRV